MKASNFLIAVLFIVALGFGVSHYTTPGTVNDPNPIHITNGHGGSPTPAGSTAKAPVRNGSLLFSELSDMLEQKPTPVVSIMLINGTNKAEVVLQNRSMAKVTIPDEGGKQELREKATEAHVSFGARDIESDPLLSFLSNWGFTIVMVVLFFLLFRGVGKTMKGQMDSVRNMGTARGRNAKESNDNIEKLTWDDIAGCDEAVTELKRVVEGLTGAEIYKKFGAKLPTGILLIGPPGTGKTRIAKIVANMCNGSFDSTSGSDFVEMLVGVGASRVRSMFEKGRAKVKETGRPHVIFIDEIDAIGGKRGSGGINSNSEREQTLNQLLVELDGVVGNNGIIVIAATNRVDMLDPALLRPGRFGNHVHVDLPDVVGREKIFAIHTKGKAPLAADVTCAKLAKISFSFSGAEIADACNRAAFLAAERYSHAVKQLIDAGVPALEAAKLVPAEISLDLFDEGLAFARYGDAKPSKQVNMSKKTKLNTARHEAGHAVAAAAFKESDPVVKITIMRRSKTLGYVQTMPETDIVGYDKRWCIARIVCAMAGRAAQEVYLDTEDSGASNDFMQATDMARAMVMEWGMTEEVGRICIQRSENGFGGGLPNVGDELANIVDHTVRKLVDKCYEAAKKIVTDERELMDRLTDKLMAEETVLGDDFEKMRNEYSIKLDVTALGLPGYDPDEVKAEEGGA